MRTEAANERTSLDAAIASLLAFGHLCRGLPEPGRWVWNGRL